LYSTIWKENNTIGNTIADDRLLFSSIQHVFFLNSMFVPLPLPLPRGAVPNPTQS
jgi:hypothetical protein